MGCLMLVGLLAAPCAEMDAQTRKKTATAASKKTTAKKTTTAPAGKPISLEGDYYEGLVKIPGSPMDGFCTMKFEGSNVIINMADRAQPVVKCSATEAAGKITVKLIDPLKGTITSKDNGSSFEGSFSVPQMKYQVWVVKVNENHVTPTMSDNELAAIIGNPDGYTGFFLFAINGMVGTIPTEVTMHDDSTFTFTMDNDQLQKFFKKDPIGYKIVDKKMVVTLPDGQEVTGEIYDDGTYIRIPFGRSDGADVALFLIR